MGSQETAERICSARLWGKRPRSLGGNARRGVHGDQVYMDHVSISIGGITGHGPSSADQADAQRLIQTPVKELFDSNNRVAPDFLEFEFPLIDWLGKQQGVPAWKLYAREGASPGEGVPAYASSLYFDDLGTDGGGVKKICDNALTDWERGHRAFKIKVGRGAWHMDLEDGIQRDIGVIRAVREALGPEAGLMIDANNGYNLNIAKTVLKETADCDLRFFEEPFHEDQFYTKLLHDWIREQGMKVMIADGEGKRSPDLIQHALDGIIDVIQLDIRWHGFTKLLELEDQLVGSEVMRSPHNYPGGYSNCASAQIAPAIDRFLYIEWDEVSFPALDASSYRFENGRCLVPDLPGMGIELDEGLFEREVEASGWQVG